MEKTNGDLKMGRKEFLREHKKLVNTLRHPTAKGLRKEAKEQGQELRKEMRRK